MHKREANAVPNDRPQEEVQRKKQDSVSPWDSGSSVIVRNPGANATQSGTSTESYRIIKRK